MFKYSVLALTLGMSIGGTQAGTVCDADGAGGNGGSTVDSSNNAFSCGHKNDATGSNSVAMGYLNKSSADASSAIGHNNTASGNHSSAVGYNNEAAEVGSSAVGFQNEASGVFSNALGNRNTASGSNSTAVGAKNTASANDSSVFGSNSTATHSGSTAIGNNSVTDRVNSISVGQAGAEKQITNVKAGTADTDAVNVKQMQDADATVLSTSKEYTNTVGQETLNSANSYTAQYVDQKFNDFEADFTKLNNDVNQNSQDIRENRKHASRGIAGITAMSNIPTPAVQGMTSFGMGVGYFDEQSAIAIGASHYFNGGVAIKGSVSNSFNDTRTTAVGAGMSFSWH